MILGSTGMHAGFSESFAQRHRGILSILAGLPLMLLPIPGMAVASLFWPQGIHGNLTQGGAVALLVVTYAVSWVVWSLTVWWLLGLGRRKFD